MAHVGDHLELKSIAYPDGRVFAEIPPHAVVKSSSLGNLLVLNCRTATILEPTGSSLIGSIGTGMSDGSGNAAVLTIIADVHSYTVPFGKLR